MFNDFANARPDLYNLYHVTIEDMTSIDDEKRYRAWMKFATNVDWASTIPKIDSYWKIRFEYYKRKCHFNSIDAMNDPNIHIINAVKNYAKSNIVIPGYWR